MARDTTKTARDIIYRALCQIGVIDTGEVADGAMMTEGLDLLNDILENWSGDGGIIPFVQQIEFPLLAGKQDYVLGKVAPFDVESRQIAQLISINFRYDQVIYPVDILSKNVYYGNLRVENLTSLPFGAFYTNDTYNSTVTFYPIPNQAYTAFLRAKFKFDEVELDDRLDEIPPYARMFFRYALMRELCDFYSKPWSAKQEQIYKELLEKVYNSAELDMTIAGTDALDPNSYYSVRGGYGY